jgi:glycosyltransferase involved in cell wall biosynthesis
MQKILIISYFFPLCNLTPSQRVVSWAKYLHNFGYYPVIITRRWDSQINVPQDMSIKTPSEIVHNKYDEYEVFYLPFKPGLKDRIYSKYGDTKYKLIRKLLSLFELILQNISVKSIPYSNIYFFTLKYLRRNPQINKLIVTANPYILFKFAYKLNKQTSIKWIADYRDAWTNCHIKYIDRNPLFNMINRYDSFFEKKWVGTAYCITSVSDTLAMQISDLVNVPWKTLHNGFLEDDFLKYRNEEPFERFTISYIGTLFAGQKIEIFLEAYIRFIMTYPNLKVNLLFPGLAFNKGLKQMVDEIMKGYEDYYEIFERIDREEILRIEVRSHLLLYVAWQGFNGIVPSKIYEYIASGSYILVTPSDNDVVEDIVRNSGCGVSLSTSDEVFDFLNMLYDKYLNGVKLTNELTSDRVMQFSRKLQVEKLSQILNSI